MQENDILINYHFNLHLNNHYLYAQGDADYLRYRGLQEFDRAMHHLEESHNVCEFVCKFSSLFCNVDYSG